MLDRSVEFVPFMAKDPIKLSARMVLRFLCTPTKSGAVCDERQAVKFVMLCQARGLNPWEGDAFLVGYDAKDGPQFSLITAHQAFLKRAETHPEYDGMESGVLVSRQELHPETGEHRYRTVELVGDYFDEGDTLVGAWARVHFKTRKHPMYKRLKLATFNTGYSRWAKDPAGMCVKCAEADALRSAFPNSLGGMYLEGEMPEGEPERKPAAAAAPTFKNGNVHQEPEPADEAAENERQNLMADLGERLEAAEGERDLADIDAHATRHRALLGNHAWETYCRSREERRRQLGRREPGAEG